MKTFHMLPGTLALMFAIGLPLTAQAQGADSASSSPSWLASSSTMRTAESADGKAVLAAVNGLFAAFEAGDGSAMLRQVHAEGRVTASQRQPGGTASLREQTWAQFAERLSPERAFEERITDPVISVDDDVAMVWAPFVVRRGGKVANCGIDHFDLVRENGIWKILSLTYSTRTDGCPAR